jgi:hypothetical protein
MKRVLSLAVALTTALGLATVVQASTEEPPVEVVSDGTVPERRSTWSSSAPTRS